MAFFRASRFLPGLSSWGLRRASQSVSLTRCVVEKADKCVVIELASENKENRLDPEFLGEFNRALDQAERYHMTFIPAMYVDMVHVIVVVFLQL